MLTFDQASIASLIEEHRRALNRVNSRGHLINGWGCGPIVDNFAGLQGAFFALLGRQDRTPGDYLRDPGDGSTGPTNESFHPIMRIRKSKLKEYDPPALDGWATKEPRSRGAGWKWMKEGLQVMPEYRLSPEKTMSVAYSEDGVIKYKVQESMSRMLCPEDILLELDRDTGIKKTG